jgi:RNA polymerase sigma factor (sigma-70 family)
MSESTRLQPELDETFNALAESHRAAFGRLARRLTRDPEDAEDLLQETLVDAYRAFHRFRANSHFYSWVARIMTNNHLDRVRRKQHPVVSLDQAGPEDANGLELPDETTNPERVILHEQMDHRFASALDALQPIHRATVLLCDVEGATYEEAAAVEQCPIGTIRSRLHRAHHAIRKFLGGFEPKEEAVPDPRIHSRRAFLRMGTAAAAGAAATAAFVNLDGVEAFAAEKPIRVLVWSEGTAPRTIYPADINTAIADGLKGLPNVEVRIASIADPEQGLSDETLANTDVLIWWGHQKHGDVRDDRVTVVARRVRHEGMGFIATHSAHYSKPLKVLLGTDCGWKGGYFEDGSAVKLEVTAPRHPIARDLTDFTIPHTERYEGEFEVPKPDVLVFDGAYAATDTRARQGMVWTVGKGRVFYFQPGHETYPIYFQEEVRKVFRNAVSWCANR